VPFTIGTKKAIQRYTKNISHGLNPCNLKEWRVKTSCRKVGYKYFIITFVKRFSMKTLKKSQLSALPEPTSCRTGSPLQGLGTFYNG